MKHTIAITALLIAGCADTLPQAADRAFAAALRDVADRYEAGTVTDAKLGAELQATIQRGRTKVWSEGFDPEFNAASKPERVTMLRRIADEAEPQPWWSMGCVVVAALAAGAVGGMEIQRRTRRA